MTGLLRSIFLIILRLSFVGILLNMSDVGPSAAWIDDVNATYEQALAFGSDIKASAEGVLASLPRKDMTRHFPPTFFDATTLVNAREETKRKQAANKAAKAKHKSPRGRDEYGRDAHCPGAVEGGSDPSPFWMYIEDFFRDLTQEDLHDLLPLLENPTNDPYFTIAPPGSGRELERQDTSQKRKRSLSPLAITQTPKQSLLNIGNATETTSSQGRRSSRILSKRGRWTDVSKYVRGRTSDPSLSPFDVRTGAEDHVIPASLFSSLDDSYQNAHLSSSEATKIGDKVSYSRLALFAKTLQELKTAVAIEKDDLDERLFEITEQISAGDRSPEYGNRDDILNWLEKASSVVKSHLKVCDIELPLLNCRRPIGKSEMESACKNGTEVGGEKKCNALIPFSGSIHPYIKLLLRMKIPSHVRQAAKDIPPMDPALALFLGKSLSSAAGGQHFAADKNLNLDSTAGTPATSNLGSGNGGIHATSSGLSGRARRYTSSPALSENNMHAVRTSLVSDGEECSSDIAKIASESSSRLHQSKDANTTSKALEYMCTPQANTSSLIDGMSTDQQMVNSGALPLAIPHLPSHPVNQAVKTSISDGKIDESVLNHFQLSVSEPKLLAAAPQDEIAAEMLALQAELAAVSVANRARLVHAFRGLLEDLPRQRAAASIRSEEKTFIISWMNEVKEEAEKKLKQRRETAHREALASVGGVGSPRPVLGSGNSFEMTSNGRIVAPSLGPEDLFDVLAQRREDEESFCAVCGDGTSIEPNVIVFCDRCDVAVHQHCYDLSEVPESEWLCWPCREYEEKLRAEGVPQIEIRPLGALPEDRRRLPGGSRDVKCALCPIKGGAFRRTMDGSQWVHTACACWHDGPWLEPSSSAEAVDGLFKIPSKRWTTACDICGKIDGAVVTCKHPGPCQYSFHVLCARNCGLYLTVRMDQQNRPLHRIYCAVHSPAQRERDAQAAAELAEGQAKEYAKLQKEEDRRVAIADLNAREEELSALRTIRTNMEQCRLLLDQCKRREKLKKQLAVVNSDFYRSKLWKPDESLNEGDGHDADQKAGTELKILSNPSMKHDLIDEDNSREDESGLCWRLESQLGDGTAIKDSEVSNIASESLKNTSSQISSRPRRAAAMRRNYDEMVSHSSRNADSNHANLKSGLLTVGDSASVRAGENPCSNGNCVASSPTVGNNGDLHCTDELSKNPSSNLKDANTVLLSDLDAGIEMDLASLPFKKQQIMSRAEAKALNEKLPPGIRYVLVDHLCQKSIANQCEAGIIPPDANEKAHTNATFHDGSDGNGTRSSARFRQKIE